MKEFKTNDLKIESLYLKVNGDGEQSFYSMKIGRLNNALTIEKGFIRIDGDPYERIFVTTATNIIEINPTEIESIIYERKTNE